MTRSAFPAAVDATLADYFVARRSAVTEIGADFAEAVAELEWFALRGGKRTRPAFAWTGWLGAGGAASGPAAAAVLRACTALELIQACALVHDDIIDGSRNRRGFPTVHVTFAAQHADRGWSGGAARFGVNTAILLGDLALAWADDMLHGAGLDSAALTRVQPVWSAMRTEVLAGQLMDVFGEAGTDESVRTAMRINRYKTAAYTVERPLHLGAAIAGAPADLIADYRAFGTDIGIAFQLRDDLLGVFGDPAVTGKPSGDDLREGKRTVLLAVALQRADATDPAAAQLLRRSIGTDLDDAAVERLRTLITELGAADDVESRIAELTERGLTTLHRSSATPAAQAELTAMAEAATRRSA
ncbi:polyprenyl synthetase family protein [Skermania piniformis]|uniref:Polyprenyl synthetase family protein n=1 Tax=Skermania pinensis TaxID=39122 RepID=A0ABX8SCU6_9ACTN|nr:polyprenyl synthetase family protein [Skermania piniformis]